MSIPRPKTMSRHSPRIWADIEAEHEQREHERRERERRTECIAAMRYAGATEAEIWAETNRWFDDPRTPAERADDHAWEEHQADIAALRQF